MAKLEDDRKRALPPSPAPPRRSANPWRFSETARKPEPRPEPVSQGLLDELMKQAPADDAIAEVETPPPASVALARPILWFLVIAGVVVLIVLRVFFEAREDGDWVGIIGPLLAIAFIAHGLWRMRQRRRARNKTKLE
jgi:hypothetical protein